MSRNAPPTTASTTASMRGLRLLFGTDVPRSDGIRNGRTICCGVIAAPDRRRRWKLTLLVILLAIGVALVMGGSALAHTFAHMSGSGRYRSG